MKSQTTEWLGSSFSVLHLDTEQFRMRWRLKCAYKYMYAKPVAPLPSVIFACFSLRACQTSLNLPTLFLLRFPNRIRGNGTIQFGAGLSITAMQEETR